MTRFARQFRKVARKLSHIELTAHRPDADRTDDAFSFLYDRDEGRRFLDFYGEEGLVTAFQAYGLTDAVRRRGYGPPRVSFQVADDRHVLFVDADHPMLERPARIIELALRRDHLVAHPRDGLPAVEPCYDVLTIDWLHLANPAATFTADRPRLPGQTCPGLGIGERVLEILYRAAARLDLHAIVTVGEYFHNAWLYAREMPFFDPWYAGQLDALGAALLEREGLSLAEASWAIHEGRVRVSGEPFRWRGELQIRSRTESLTAYLTHPAWAAHAERAARECPVELLPAPTT